MKQLLCSVLSIYLVVLIIRAIMSFFPIQDGSVFASIYRIMLDLTEPVLAPVRRIIPPAGMFDLSFLVVFIGLQIIMRAMNCSFLLF